MKGYDKNATRLYYMLECIEELESLTEVVSEEKFKSDFMIYQLAERQLEIIGEAAARLDKSFKEKHSEVEWLEMSDLRKN